MIEFLIELWAKISSWQEMNIGSIILFFTSLFTLGAAVGAWLSAKAIKKTGEAQIYSRFLEEYSSKEMLNDLRVLRKWKSDHGDEFAKKWLEALRTVDSKDNQHAYEVDIARRHVKFYFLKALKIYENRYVKKQFLEEIGKVDGITILYDIVEPLECILNPDYGKSSFVKLQGICPRVDTKVELIQPMPHQKDQ